MYAIWYIVVALDGSTPCLLNPALKFVGYTVALQITDWQLEIVNQMTLIPRSNLGTLRAQHALPREEFYQSLLVFLLIGGLFLAYVLVVLTVFVLADRGPEILLVAAVIIALLAVPSYRLVRYARRLFSWRTVSVYDNGFVLTERGRDLIVTWDDIDTYTVRGLRLGVDYLRESDAAQMSARLAQTLTIKLSNGQQIEIDTAVRQMSDVIAQIGRRFAMHHYPAAQQRITERGQYYFGNLIVEGDRMTFREIGYRWYQLQRVVFDVVGDLVVEQQGAPRPRPVLPAHKIPNPHLLMLLLSPHATVIDFDGATVSAEAWLRYIKMKQVSDDAFAD